MGPSKGPSGRQNNRAYVLACGMTRDIRPASAADAAQLCAVLNPIIAAGGTTAHKHAFSPERMTTHYIAPETGVSCLVAQADGQIIGFQALKWMQDQPGWATIATFVQPGGHGRGTGAALFAATRLAAQAAGVTTIDATIRTENTGGLRFYTRLGFKDYREEPERVSKRFDLG